MLKTNKNTAQTNLKAEDLSNKRKNPLKKTSGKKINGDKTSHKNLEKMLPRTILFFKEPVTISKVFIASILLGKEKRIIEKPSQ